MSSADDLQKRSLSTIWHPYTQMKDIQDGDLLAIDHAEGIYLYDTNGKAYIDGFSSWWLNVHGHRHPRLMKAITAQLESLDHVAFAGSVHEPSVVLAEEILKLLPGHFSKVFYSDNGSTAVEVALKMAYQYNQLIGKKKKTKFVYLDHSYHGDTLGTVSVSGVDAFFQTFKKLRFKAYRAQAPYCYRCPIYSSIERCRIDCFSRSLDQGKVHPAIGEPWPVEEIIETYHAEIAAVIVEPLVMGAGGFIIYPREYLKKLAELCKRKNVILIFDEVMTGFGRTGKMFAMNWDELEPDMVCLSKGLTGGILPLAATVVTEPIYQAFYGTQTFYHGHSYTANPIACAVAIENIKIFKDERVIENLLPKIDLIKQLANKLDRFPQVADIRCLGMICAFELVYDRYLRQNFDDRLKLPKRICREARQRGLFIRPLGNMIYLILPLIITEEEIERCFEILNQSLEIVFAPLIPSKDHSEEQTQFITLEDLD